MPPCRGKFKLFQGIQWINSIKVALFAESLMLCTNVGSPTIVNFSSPINPQKFGPVNIVWDCHTCTIRLDTCRRYSSVPPENLFTILRRVYNSGWRQRDTFKNAQWRQAKRRYCAGNGGRPSGIGTVPKKVNVLKTWRDSTKVKFNHVQIGNASAISRAKCANLNYKHRYILSLR